MIKAGIIGSTGYAGAELVRLLLGHKDVEIVWYGSRSYIDKRYSEVYQNMFRLVENVCQDDNMKELADQVGMARMDLDCVKATNLCTSGSFCIFTDNMQDFFLCQRPRDFTTFLRRHI